MIRSAPWLLLLFLVSFTPSLPGLPELRAVLLTLVLFFAASERGGLRWIASGVLGIAMMIQFGELSGVLVLSGTELPARLLRLARVAAVALPFLALAFARLSRERPPDRWARWGGRLMVVGMVGMPLLLFGAALLHPALKYLLFIPADAMTLSVSIAAVLAWRRGAQLAALSWGLVGLSMVFGLLMGVYAFDGPLPSPVGPYDDALRQSLRASHILSMLGGLLGLAWADARARAHAAAARRAASFLGPELDRLNRGSLEKSFVPQTDLDYSVPTTDEEYEALYGVWSLLLGSGKDAAFSTVDKVRYQKAQQVTLMRFTALLERHGMSCIARLYDEPIAPELADYVGHFIKEETYHYSMFNRAIEALQETEPAIETPPWRAFDRSLRMIFLVVGLIPSARVRLAMTFTMFRFAEQVSMYAHDMVRKTLPRREGLVAQVWARHAMDEARHLKFDDMVIERTRLPRPFSRLPELLILPACVWMSLLLNNNELWMARRLGVRVHLWHLPGLVAGTSAPFKRRVFKLVSKMSAGAGALETVEP